MNKLFTLLIALLATIGAAAQQTGDVAHVAERFKTMKTLVTDVSQTRHNAMLTADIVTRGKFYFKKPDNLCMDFPDSGERLLAVGSTFAMVRNGKAQTAKASGKGNNPFEALREVFRNLLSADEDSSLSDLADVDFKKQGNSAIITVEPIVTDPQAKRRMPFTSCVLTIDLKAAELRSLRINERGTNYTQYDFSNYAFNAPVPDAVFEVK